MVFLLCYLLLGEFFEKYHAGVVNKLLHFFGFALWGIGLGKKSWILIIIAPIIFESGHIFNYFTGRKTKYDRLMIPVQLVTWLGFILLAKVLLFFF